MLKTMILHLLHPDRFCIGPIAIEDIAFSISISSYTDCEFAFFEFFALDHLIYGLFLCQLFYLLDIFSDYDRPGLFISDLHLISVYTILDSLSFHDRTIDMKSKEYRNSKKTIMLFTEILSCTQIGMYSRYLTLYNTLLNDSNLILTQLIATACSIGNTERLKELFHENGINSGDELLRDSKK